MSETCPAGWTIEEDGWYTRSRKPNDPEIHDEPSFGFTMPNAVYVRTPSQARLYDKGVTKGDPI